MKKRWDCLIIGAGAAGIGIGTVLKELGLQHYAILERHSIGASFGMWPDEMRLITPSFTSNAYGMLDLNAVALNTSPAYTLNTEHPTGQEYAKYLQALSDYHELPVHCGIEVTEVQQEVDGFCVTTSTGDWHARFVIWAAGEFQYPRLDAIPGSEYAIHNSQVTSWAALEGEQVVVIGGYESGTDAAIHLSRSGKKVTMLDRRSRLLDKGSSDPSMELSPYTKDRLRQEIQYGRISFIGGCEVQWIEPEPNGGYNIYCEDDHSKQHVIHSEATPILATGFSGSLHLIEHLIQRSGNGAVKLGPADESLITPGLFVSGPSVMHDQLMFCFIYKFRQRFAVIAHRIGTLLQYDVSRLEHYRREGMFLDDLSCCQENCTC